jgi:hypothetical protein
MQLKIGLKSHIDRKRKVKSPTCHTNRAPFFPAWVTTPLLYYENMAIAVQAGQKTTGLNIIIRNIPVTSKTTLAFSGISILTRMLS